MEPIVVIGAGPAGVVCALGLCRLGFEVVVINSPRSFAAVEGTTLRVLQSLQQLGLIEVLECIKEQTARRVIWSGEDSSRNSEFLIDRALFDVALISELDRAKIKVIHQSVASIQQNDRRFAIRLKDGNLVNSSFLVEARGRQAAASGKGRRGPETVSLLNRWQGEPGQAATTVTSLSDAWCWMAKMSDGRCYWQLTLDAKQAKQGGKKQLIDYCAQRRQACNATQEFFAHQPKLEAIDLHVRSSTATLSKDIVGDNWIRIGDAAMAVDPLSGNGIFQAMSSALQAPAVIQTLIKKPTNKLLAQAFHRSRVEHLFLRFARLGRDFYTIESQWSQQEFWRERSHWPDQQPMHRSVMLEEINIATLPVIERGFIVEKQVVTTPDQPLGMWHLEGIELVPFVAALKQQGLEHALQGYTSKQQGLLKEWLSSTVQEK